MEYIKKPIIIEAIKYTGNNINEIKEFAGFDRVMVGNKLIIKSLEGLMDADIGDYIIKGVKGEIYPCRPDIFKLTYSDFVEDLKETHLIDDLVLHFAKIIAEEQTDCKNIDYRLPETKRICLRLQEIENEIINVARALQFNSGKSKPLGETGYPRSYKRWENQLDKRLAHEHLI